MVSIYVILRLYLCNLTIKSGDINSLNLLVFICYSCSCLQEELEKEKNRAARFTYTFEVGSTTGILKQLKWESPKKKGTNNRHILLY